MKNLEYFFNEIELWEVDEFNDINIVIWSPDYNCYSGGIIALNYLAHLLKCYGLKNIFIFSNQKASWCSAKEIRSKTLLWKICSKEKTYVLYPEIVKNNPLESKYLGRWYLGVPSELKENIKQHSKEDDYWSYNPYSKSELMKLDIDSKDLGLLLTRKLQFYQKNSTDRRNGICFSIRKGKVENQTKYEKQNWTSIDNFSEKGGYSYLSKIFQEKAYFYSFDPNSYLNSLAAMSGIISVIHPEKNLIEPKKWRELTSNRYGIAYGFEDQEHAISTLPKVKENIFINESDNREKIIEFIKHIFEKITTNQFGSLKIKLEKTYLLNSSELFIYFIEKSTNDINKNIVKSIFTIETETDNFEGKVIMIIKFKKKVIKINLSFLKKIKNFLFNCRIN